MFSIAGIDLLEQELLDHERTLLEILLQDKTTKKNIIWATDDYAELGEPYSFKKEILPELVTGEQDSLIQPRVEKALEHQTNRTRDKAEVFTPSWICNAQNNLVDEQWFGRKDVFNIQKEMSWKATADKIAFPDDRQHTWQKYVDAQRLEISCGEAPYLVSRYDTVTGETIPISQRIGLLDRKLRVVSENTDTEEEWFTWTSHDVPRLPITACLSRQTILFEVHFPTFLFPLLRYVRSQAPYVPQLSMPAYSDLCILPLRL